MSITAFATRRARTLRLAAVGLTAVAALTLTACNSNEDSGTKNEGKADTPSSAPADQTSGGSDATGGASDGKKGGGAQDAGSSKDGAKGSDGAKSSGGSGGSDNSEQEIGPCDINKLTVGVKSVQRPVNY
ncbi:DUF4232 domain-containing protein, partial [Streptomyces sp. NPDC000941]